VGAVAAGRGLDVVVVLDFRRTTNAVEDGTDFVVRGEDDANLKEGEGDI
jgi:hypothetical protein